jgi:hypothetical protein
MAWQAAFVEAHRVCWEVTPHVESCAGRLRRAGFDLTLHAQVAGLDPGSHEAASLHERLRELALLVLPAGVQATLQRWSPRLQLRRETGWRSSEVDLVVEVRDADAQAARAIRSALLSLGVPENAYLQAA